MTLKTNIKDGKGTNNLAGVTSVGELVVTGYGDNITSFLNMNVNNTAFNFFPPLSGHVFIITSILFNAQKAPVTIDIYQAASATTTTIDLELIQIVAQTIGFVPITFPFGGFIPVTEGEFLNAKNNNQPVSMTIVGFYKPTYKPDMFRNVQLIPLSTGV